MPSLTSAVDTLSCHGNPLLKPAQEYELKMTYILKSKYIFSAWFNHTKDYSVQTLYQSSERLVEIYKTLNFDYQQQAGIQASIPFKVKNWLNSRLTLIGLWHREKDGDFWDIPFDRKQCYGIAPDEQYFYSLHQARFEADGGRICA